MKNIFIASGLALLAVSPIFAQSVPSTGLSDWGDVIEAVHEANANGEGTIYLKSNAEIEVERSLPNVTGVITFIGNGATLKSVSGYNGTIVTVESSGRLDLMELDVTGLKR